MKSREESLHIVAKRTVDYMLKLAQSAPKCRTIDETNINMSSFVSVGMCLAFIFEETTGHSAVGKHPREIMKWAMDLPIQKEAKVIKLN